MPDQSHAEYRLSRFYFEETAATELKSVNIRPRTRCKCPPSPPQSALASFALDRSNCLSARELRKNNVRIKLQEQPFRVLVELVANAGKVVSREELQQKLWPADTFVDFDVGLNTAIRKLRQALNDDTDNPHYIETLAKRGYRFVASVTDIATKSAEQQLQTLPDGIQVSDRLSVSSLESAGPVNALARSTRRWVWIPAGVVVVAIATAVVSLLNRPPAVPIVEAVTQLTDDGEPKPYTSRIVSDGVRVYFD